jgi:hypothetical protein
MTQDGDIYSYTAEVGANKYFAFFKDTQGWNYQRGPARGNDSAPLGDWEDTQAGGAWKITAAGTYTFEYNYSTDQARIVAGSIVEPDPFDADALTFVATGDAVGGWNMPPTVVFTKNNDGTHSLEIDATAAEFKIAGVKDYSSLGWGDFDAGVYGGATLALGDNTLTAGQTANMVVVRMRGDDIIQRLDIVLHQIGINPTGALAGAAVDQHVVPVTAKERRVALSDVDEVHGQPVAHQYIGPF